MLEAAAKHVRDFESEGDGLEEHLGDLVQFLLCYFLERLSILDILMVMCLNTIK